MAMERELIRFNTCEWFNDPSVEMVIVENEDPVMVPDVPVFEAELDNIGLAKGLTGAETSETYHQVLTGVEGWLVNLVSKEYTRIDRFEIVWLHKNKGYPRMELNAFTDWVKKRPGQFEGKQFGI
jgi:hypothetical protein